ncbi:uncharacterized protein LOC108250967 isoform X2 [Kryptolebias marmoratus]|uniref:uncharacterized protein LOC108250967 isoform X2 n=1 Tax=Kryptolebias marmoratus TaxID=37003 RepID=UPI0018AC9788|nr:uncharacterized protein LOC108250967 isoform X2 [Kryptolebias marmoratus]
MPGFVTVKTRVDVTNLLFYLAYGAWSTSKTAEDLWGPETQVETVETGDECLISEDITQPAQRPSIIGNISSKGVATVKKGSTSQKVNVSRLRPYYRLKSEQQTERKLLQDHGYSSVNLQLEHLYGSSGAKWEKDVNPVQDGLGGEIHIFDLDVAPLCSLPSSGDDCGIFMLMVYLVVFMGSQKYPAENGFDAFLKKHGGSDNASTDCERTIFQFDVQRKYFREALDRWAQFFICPLMIEDAVDREVEAVDSEYQLARPSDSHRKEMLFGNLAKPGHPMSKFFWGNAQTLKHEPKEKQINTYRRLRDFWRRYYSAHYMTLTVQSRGRQHCHRLTRCRLTRCSLTHHSLTHCRLTLTRCRLTLTRCSLTRCSLTRCRLIHHRLTRCRLTLTRCSLTRCSLTRCSLTHCSLTHCSLTHCRLTLTRCRLTLTRCSLTRCRLTRCSLTRCSLIHHSLTHCRLIHHRLTRCRLTRCSLTRCSLTCCSLTRCSLTHCSLTRCRLIHHRLTRCRLTLTRCSLTLIRCSLTHCSLTRCRLTHHIQQ